MRAKGELLNYFALSLFMVALSAPTFRYPVQNAAEKLIAERINQTRARLQQRVPKFKIRNQSTTTILESFDRYVIANNHRVIDSIIDLRRLSRLEPNFIRQAIDVLNLHSLVKTPKKNLKRRQTSAQKSYSFLTDGDSWVSDKPYEKFFDDFEFNGNNVDEFMQHVTTMSAAQYSLTPDEEKLLSDLSKNAPAADVDFFDVLKTRRNDSTSGTASRRRKKREEVIFAESFYPESTEEIVKRVLKQREKEEKEAEAGDDADERPRRAGITALKSGMPKSLVPYLSKSKALLEGGNKSTGEINVDMAKVFIYDLTKLDKQYKLYYACMEEKKKWYMKYVWNPMEAVQHVMITSSQQVDLSCHVCLPPLVSAKTYGVRWMRRLLSKGGFVDVPSGEEEEENFVIDDDGKLIIMGVAIEDAGMYTCFKNGAHEATYFLGVENAVDRRRVYESGGEKGKRPAGPEILSTNNLYVKTVWSEWTQCNMCNQRGQRKRTGMCHVKKYVQHLPTQPQEAQILKRYPSGVPCRSAILPPFVAELVVHRPSEFMIGYCFMECTTLQAITYITDMNGRAVEIVLTGKGRKSLRGSPPPAPKDMERSTVYANSGHKVTLECPTEEEDNNGKMPIRWQNGSQMLDEMAINDESQGRIYIDYNNKLVIKSAERYDRAVYSCWINLVRIAIIRLEVAAPIDWTVKSVVSGFCFVFFVLMMIYLGVHLVNFSNLRPVDKVHRRQAALEKEKKKKKKSGK